MMSEGLYKEQVRELTKKRSQLNKELTAVELELLETPRLSTEAAVDGTQELLRNLDLTDKKFIVRKIVYKIVATQKEAIIWGHIPIMATEQVGLHANYRDRGVAERRQIDPV
jgi:hypothetical protein